MNMTEELRLMIVDCHQLFRECLSAALREADAADEVEVAASTEEALQRLETWQPNVVLIGLDLGGEEALQLTRRIVERFGRVRVLILGGEEARPEIVACLEAGARGYVFREQSLEELRSAIELVAHGETVCTPAIAHFLFSRLGELGLEHRRRERLEFLDLTARELEILRLIADGLTNKQIAQRLYLSVHTVKNHVHNLLERLGLASRTAAVQHAYKRGWFRERRRMELSCE
jgi:DNA-binding NarL/FixJ family response regulator